MIKILPILILLLCVNTCSAGEIDIINTTVYVYDNVDDNIKMSTANNYNRTICINSTVIEGEIKIKSWFNYELEYTFICDINDSYYVTRIVTLKQETINNGWFAWDTVERTLTIDGITIGSYQFEKSLFVSGKYNTLYYCLLDNEIRFGDQVYYNEPLAFTQLNYNEQYDFLVISPYNPIEHKYISVGSMNDTFTPHIGGLTGIFYNVFGDTFLTQIPVIGGVIANFGKAIQALIFLPLSIIQFSFNIIFTILNLFAKNWWYAMLLLEIVCIIPALSKNTYPETMSTYIRLHVKIFVFFYEIIILNTINLIMRMIEIIRNMFRI